MGEGRKTKEIGKIRLTSSTSQTKEIGNIKLTSSAIQTCTLKSIIVCFEVAYTNDCKKYRTSMINTVLNLCCLKKGGGGALTRGGGGGALI